MLPRALSLLVLGSLAVAKGDPLSYLPDSTMGLKIQSTCSSPNQLGYFFPGGLLDNFPPGWREDLTRKWFSRHLHAMEEPSMYCEGTPTETYRVLSLPSFDRPVAVRVFRQGEGGRLVAVELNGQGGYRPGWPARRIDRLMPAQEWAAFKSALQRSDFWHQPIQDPLPGGRDGSELVLEGRARGRYYVVERWGQHYFATQEVAELLLRAAGMY